MQSQPSHTTKHGVFVDVFNQGILLSGASGIGKSEIALGLIDRGHRLVADDSVMFEQVGNELIGRSPEVLKNFLEVRGLGILNIEKLIGNHAITDSIALTLIINIIFVKPSELYKIDRLHGLNDQKIILEHTIPSVSIPVAPGRNLAILVEAAVKNHMLKQDGYSASDVFEQQQLHYMNTKRTPQ
jgi:HPr kinase/phosphorylase